MNASLRLLIIEDSEDDARLIVRELTRAGYEPSYVRVDTEAAVRAALDSGPWDIIVSDFSMPRFSGTHALRLLRERDQDTPFIFVSGTIGEDIAVEAMRAGAQDYVTKGNLRRLAPAIERERRDAAVRRERRASEARFRRVVDSATVGIAFWDPQGRITDANDLFLKMVGYTRDDLQAGRVDRRLMTPPEHDAADAKALEELTARGTCTPYEKQFIRKDGSRVPIIMGAALLDEPDHPVVAFVLDITERTRAEDEMRARGEHLSSIYQTVADVVFALTVEGENEYRFASVNPAFLSATGLRPEQVVGKQVDEIIPEPSLTVALGKYREAIRDKGIVRWEETSSYPSGVRTGEVSVAPVFDSTGRCSHLVGSVHDVTERKRATDALRARERQQAAVAKLGERAIEAADLTSLLEAAVVLVSETLDVPFCKMLELQLDGKSLLLRAGVGWREGSVGHVMVGTGAESQAGYTLQRNEPVISDDVRAETRFRGADLLHSHGIVSGVTVPIPTKTRPFGILGAHTDRPGMFTQDDIHFLQAVAHILGTTIDRDRAETASRQSQRLESVGRLAGGVAHDFNNLLTAITGYSQLLLQDLPPGDPKGSDLEEIIKAAMRAASLTRQLLAFSRRQVLEVKPLDLNSIVQDMEKMLRRLIGADIELQTVLRPHLGTIKADPGQIEQVILNLVVNARDAMPKGGRVILETANVELDASYGADHPDAQPGSYVMLATADTGVGMDKDIQSHIFEPFFTTKGPEKGTGLGLATVYGIVKQSGGNIWVYSEPGHGTTFKIHFPLVVERAAVARPSGKASLPTHGSETVLLAEDEESVRRLAVRVLQHVGYHVLVAQNGTEALLISERHQGPIHLLVSDVVMPQMGGADLVRRLAATRPDLRVLFLSGYTDPSIVEQGLLESGAAFLQKPFTTEALTQKVREVLDAAGSA
jgi:PAS domain S-box-containing protein